MHTRVGGGGGDKRSALVGYLGKEGLGSCLGGAWIGLTGFGGEVDLDLLLRWLNEVQLEHVRRDGDMVEMGMCFCDVNFWKGGVDR
jgi:hypothetical protein